MKVQAATSRQMLDLIPVIRLSLGACSGIPEAGNTHLQASEPRAQLMLAVVMQDSVSHGTAAFPSHDAKP